MWLTANQIIIRSIDFSSEPIKVVELRSIASLFLLTNTETSSLTEIEHAAELEIISLPVH